MCFKNNLKKKTWIHIHDIAKSELGANRNIFDLSDPISLSQRNQVVCFDQINQVETNILTQPDTELPLH